MATSLNHPLILTLKNTKKKFRVRTNHHPIKGGKVNIDWGRYNDDKLLASELRGGYGTIRTPNWFNRNLIYHVPLEVTLYPNNMSAFN